MTINSIILSILVFILPAFTDTFDGKVVKISDGDTIDVMRDGKPLRIRLFGIDCPEIAHRSGETGQPFGQNAKEFTSNLVGGEIVTVEIRDTDRYGRTVGIVVLSGGRTLNEELLKAGLAWHYTNYDHNEKWQEMEDNAKQAKRGLWADKNQTPPWEFRHAKKP